MADTDRLANELQRVYSGDAWYGPSVRKALDGVDTQMATARPLAGGHTIAELVLHMTAWTREVTRRLEIGIAQDPADGDWPTRVPQNNTEWQGMLSALDAANAGLVAAVRSHDPARLSEKIGDQRNPATGSGVSRYVNIRGLIEHHIYHAGQISLLKKAGASR
jgi:uncharacterized damage-inducible protein DinB